MGAAGGGDANNGGGDNRSSVAIPIPVIPAGQMTWFGRALDWIDGKVASGWHAVTDFVEHDAMPFLGNFLKQTALDEIAMIEKEAVAAGEQLLAQMPDLIPRLFTEPGQFTGAVLEIARTAGQNIAAQGIVVAESSVLTAAQAAVHNMISAAKPAAS